MSKKTKVTETVLADSALFMESYIEQGSYQKKMQLNSLLKQSKEFLRQEFNSSEIKRHEFPNVNMVAKFVKQNVYEVDHEGLIEQLFNILKPEIVCKYIQLDPKRMELRPGLMNEMRQFELPQKFYVKPNFNKAGRAMNQTIDYLFGGQSIESLLLEIQQVSDELSILDKQFDTLKEQIAKCPILQQKKKVPHKYGSISLVPNRTEWDNVAIVKSGYNELFFMEYAKVKVTELQEGILEGFVPKSLLDEHRKITDIRLDFVVMRLDVEARIFEVQRNKRIRASLKKFA